MIIGISGKAGCGKSTLTEMLIEALGDDWVHMSLGDEVKKEASELFNFPLWMAYCQEGKNAIIDVTKPGENPSRLTVRQLLQYWGTDVRRAEDPEYWVKKLQQHIPAGKNVIVDDIRFESEVDFIKSHNGRVFRINAYDGYIPPSTGAEHISETELDDYPFFDLTFAPKFGELRKVAERIVGFLGVLIGDMVPLLPEEIEAMNRQSDITLAEWWCSLNNWQWPDGLPNKQDPPKDLSDKEMKDWRGGIIRKYIERKIGHRLCSRVWNREMMTDKEHDDFYNGNFCGDQAAMENDEIRRRNR